MRGTWRRNFHECLFIGFLCCELERAAWLTALGVEITIRTLIEFMRYESTDRPRLFSLLD